MNPPAWAYVTGIICACIFTCASVPDTIAALRADKLVGASWKSSAITAVALMFAVITNIGFENYPFMISDSIGVVLVSFLAVRRYQLSRKP